MAILVTFVAAVVFGFFSFQRLPVTLMPELTYPTLTVRTEYPGAAPQEVENELALHPQVADVAVIGVPNADLGEEVKAVVLPARDAVPGDELAAALIAHCRDRLAHFKCPVSVDFVDELPRLPSGKLLKRQLRSRYWPD